ncbi:MAG TPA: replication initiator [Actinomycetes bacterium]|nr:replication initiator [Actinomycetes bacterium]
MAPPSFAAVDHLAATTDPATFTPGFCVRPVRLAGTIEHVDRRTGEARQAYSTDEEPGGVLLKACGNRRASRCPACAKTYAGDARQLITAGLRGGKGIPETVTRHPRLFATFTAPGFGPVHTRRSQHGNPLPCHPRDPNKRCPHGRREACWHRHPETETRTLGQPLCADCFDYQGLALWNAVAPELWRRTMGVYVYRALAHLLGWPEAEVRRTVRVRYTKVAEYQARGAVHFHAVIRLDATPPADDPERVTPPPVPFTAKLLAAAVRLAALGCGDFHPAAVPYPPVAEGPARLAGWGTQLDVRAITGGDPGDLSAEAVANYLAKYATKATEAFAGLDRRIRKAEELDHLRVGAHLARLVRTCWDLGAHPALAGLRLRQWAHALGFRGHWSTKSRRYSTTFTALRRARAAWAVRRRLRGGEPLDVWGRRAADQDAAVVLGTWTYKGSGYSTIGDAWLAEAAAARARDHESTARARRAAA